MNKPSIMHMHPTYGIECYSDKVIDMSLAGRALLWREFQLRALPRPFAIGIGEQIVMNLEHPGQMSVLHKWPCFHEMYLICLQ